MKKIIYTMLILIVSLFVMKDVKALSTLNANLDFNETDYFNIFREFNSQTPLSKFLIQQGYEIFDYLKGVAESEVGRKYQGFDLNSVLIRKFSDDTIHFFLVSVSDINVDSSENTYNILQSDGYELIYDLSMNLKEVHYYALNDTQAEKGNLREKIGNLGYWGKGNLTEIFSTFYYTNGTTLKSNDYREFLLMEINQNNETKEFDGFDLKKFLFGTNLDQGMDAYYGDNFDLRYYKENFFRFGNQYKSLCELFFIEEEMIVPEGYESFTIETSSETHFLTFKGNVGVDSTLYYYSSYSDKTFYSSSYQFQGNEMVHLSDYVIRSNQSNTVYGFDPLSSYGLESLNETSFMFYSMNNKYKYTVYYDPDAYNHTLAVGSSDFVLSNNDNSYTITGTKLSKIKHQSIVNNQEKEEESGNTSSIGSFDFSASTILNGFKKFIGSVSGIASAINSMFSNLPSELVALLYSGFTMGIIAMIIKIIL